MNEEYRLREFAMSRYATVIDPSRVGGKYKAKSLITLNRNISVNMAASTVSDRSDQENQEQKSRCNQFADMSHLDFRTMMILSCDR